jgi:hypothetical protein
MSIKGVATTGIDSVTGLSVRLYNPRIDVRSGHFKWRGGYKIISGYRPIGRVAIKRLQLTPRVGKVAKIMVSAGLHPPSGTQT